VPQTAQSGPSPSRELQWFVPSLLNTEVTVLESKDGWLLVASEVRPLGYVATRDLAPGCEEAHEADARVCLVPRPKVLPTGPVPRPIRGLWGGPSQKPPEGATGHVKTPENEPMQDRSRALL